MIGPRRVALVILAAAIVLVMGLPAVVDGARPTVDPDACDTYVQTIEYAREPAELNFSDDDTARYDNLTDDQQALFDRSFADRGQNVPISAGTYRQVHGEMPSLVRFEGAVYRVGVRIGNCPIVPGVPTTFDPLILLVLRINALVTGPLAPIIVVGGGLGLAGWVGRKLQY